MNQFAAFTRPIPYKYSELYLACVAYCYLCRNNYYTDRVRGYKKAEA